MELLSPDASQLQRLVARQGANGFRNSVEQRLICCNVRKVQPLTAHLQGLDAWISGLRRDQSAGRANTPKLDWDRKHGLWKLNPLADWTERDVWSYLVANDVPYHPLHDRGYSSIGCTHCTHPGGDRAGRWAGTDKIECGIHAG
jgi:phosphoadenosine phosphosulfate reductase